MCLAPRQDVTIESTGGRRRFSADVRRRPRGGAMARSGREQRTSHGAMGWPILAFAAMAGALITSLPDPVRADASAAGINCIEIPGSVSFGSLHVTPVQPKVGDSILLQFDATFAVYMVGHTTLL